MALPPPFTEELVHKVAQHVVQSYESINEKAETFQRKFKCSDAARESYVSMLHEACGGKEMYEVSKALLAAQTGK